MLRCIASRLPRTRSVISPPRPIHPALFRHACSSTISPELDPSCSETIERFAWQTEVVCSEKGLGEGFGVRIYHCAKRTPEPPVILYIPPFHQTYDPDENPKLLACSSQCTIYTPYFAQEIPIFPLIFHHILRAHDHIMATHFPFHFTKPEPDRPPYPARYDPPPPIPPPAYSFVGTGLGGGIATALAVSESIHHNPPAFFGIWNSFVDLSLFPELLKFDYHLGNWNYDPPRNYKYNYDTSKELQEFKNFVNLRSKYAKYPEQWVDQFASPLLWFLHCGYDMALPPDAGYINSFRQKNEAPVYRPQVWSRRSRTVLNTLIRPCALPLARIVVPSEDGLLRTQNSLLARGLRRNFMVKKMFDGGYDRAMPTEEAGDLEYRRGLYEDSIDDDLEKVYKEEEEGQEGVVLVDLREMEEEEKGKQVVVNRMGKWMGAMLRAKMAEENEKEANTKQYV